MKTEQNDITNNSTPPIQFNLRLRSIKSSQQTFARLIRAFGKGEIEEKPFKSLIWALNCYSGYLKLNTEDELLSKLKDIEKSMEKK